MAVKQRLIAIRTSSKMTLMVSLYIKVIAKLGRIGYDIRTCNGVFEEHMKRIVGIILGLAIVVAGFLWITRPTAKDATAAATPSNHIYGEGKKNVTLVEYGDFQCPACKAFYPLVKDVKEKYKTDIFFQFRNFPLETIHQNARAGARAAEAASMQDKFWEMHNALYDNQDAWKDSSNPLTIFSALAKQAGVADIAKFEEDYRGSTVNSIINADLQEAHKLGANSTPTFVLDGKKIEDNPRDAESFYKLIDDAIAAKNPTS